MSRFARTIHIWCIPVQFFWQGNHQIYGHVQCTILANLRYEVGRLHSLTCFAMTCSPGVLYRSELNVAIYYTHFYAEYS